MGYTISYAPKVYGPIVDKLSFVMKENSLDNRKEILSNLAGYEDNGYCFKSNASHHKKLYQLTYVFADGLSSNGTILVQCEPTQNDQSSYIRISMNPAQTQIAELTEYLDIIVPGGYQRVVNEAWITRIDIAFDIPNVNINDLLVMSGKARKSSQFQNQGNIETQYFGDRKSALEISVYDKLAQMKKFKKEYPQKHLSSHFKEIKELTRVEARVRPRGAGKLLMNTLPAMSNPFSSFVVSHYAGIKTTDKTLRMAVEIASLSDFKRARLFLSEYESKQFTKLLSSNMCSWWNTDALWERWPDQASRLLNPNIAH